MDRQANGDHPLHCNCQRSIAEWYFEFASKLLRFTYAITDDHGAAEDCMHETFMRALANRDKFMCRGDGVAPWLFTIARNLASTYRTSTVRRREQPSWGIYDGCIDDISPEEMATRQEACAALAVRMRELSAEQALCLRLRFLEDCSVSETARAMNRREPAIRALQYRAIRTLRPKLVAYA